MVQERHSFGSLETLTAKGTFPVTEADKEAILNYLYKEVPIYYDEKLHVHTATGLYIADLYSERQKLEESNHDIPGTKTNDYIF